MKRTALLLALVLPLALLSASDILQAQTQEEVTNYVRFEVEGRTAYGILDGQTVRELGGWLFDLPDETGRTYELAEVDLLAPVEPRKVMAVGLNYESHLGGQEPPPEPPIFLKLPTNVVGPGDEIIKPSDSRELHFEGELVIVIGREASEISRDEALDYVFGVTAGNDVSERVWQGNDMQWWRAKAADTFGPIGPTIVRGVNYDDLLLTTRLNGEVVQQQRTSDFIHDVSAMVSFISRYVTLHPGDVIFTGTPGTTSGMEVGDIVEVEVENVGVLRNRIAAEARAAASR